MMYLQILKDVDDIDHLTLEKNEDDAHEAFYHFRIRRIAPEKFSLEKGGKLLKHMETWYPETAEVVGKTDFSDGQSVYQALRAVREILLNLI